MSISKLLLKNTFYLVVIFQKLHVKPKVISFQGAFGTRFEILYRNMDSHKFRFLGIINSTIVHFPVWFTKYIFGNMLLILNMVITHGNTVYQILDRNLQSQQLSI